MFKHNKSWVKVLLSGVCALGFACHSTGAMAQAQAAGKPQEQILEDIYKTLQDIGTLMNNTIFKTTEYVAQLLWTESPDVDATMKANTRFKATVPQAMKQYTKFYINDEMKRFMTPGSPSVPAMFKLLPGRAQDVERTIPNFSFNSLLEPDVYNTASNNKENERAYYFIRTVLNADRMPRSLNISDIARGGSSELRYMTKFANFAAVHSVALYNLFKSYSKRLPQQGLGSKVGMIKLYPDMAPKGARVGQPIANASPLQADRYLAERRVLNPKWYTEIEKAPPASVSRETLYVLAEIRNEMFKQRIATERLIDTISALNMHSAEHFARQPELARK